MKELDREAEDKLMPKLTNHLQLPQLDSKYKLELIGGFQSPTIIKTTQKLRESKTKKMIIEQYKILVNGSEMIDLCTR